MGLVTAADDSDACGGYNDRREVTEHAHDPAETFVERAAENPRR